MAGGHGVLEIDSPLVCGGCPERYDQTKDNTQYRQKLVANRELYIRMFVNDRNDWGNKIARLVIPQDVSDKKCTYLLRPK